MGFGDHCLLHFFYRQALDLDIGLTESYCPLADPDFGH